MADNFGLKIGVEGEKGFKKALSDINQSFKVLGSEMKLVESAFDKNDGSVEALAARNQALNREIEAQKQKIETLRSALANASESFGENDRRTQNWQIQLNNATAALNQMERELDGNEKALDNTGKELDEAGKEADDFGRELKDAGDDADNSGGKFEKLGSVAKGVGAAMGAAMAAIAAAAVAAGKQLWDMANDVAQTGGRHRQNRPENRHQRRSLPGVGLCVPAVRGGREKPSGGDENPVRRDHRRRQRLGFCGGKAGGGGAFH